MNARMHTHTHTHTEHNNKTEHTLTQSNAHATAYKMSSKHMHTTQSPINMVKTGAMILLQNKVVSIIQNNFEIIFFSCFIFSRKHNFIFRVNYITSFIHLYMYTVLNTLYLAAPPPPPSLGNIAQWNALPAGHQQLHEKEDPIKILIWHVI